VKRKKHACRERDMDPAPP